MSRAAGAPRLRRMLLGAVALLLIVAALALLVLGAGLLIAGIFSWLRPINVALAWARTLVGVGLMGGGAGLAAAAWLAFRGMAQRPTIMDRKLKFAAVIGSLLALICLPFGAAIGAMSHVSWFG